MPEETDQASPGFAARVASRAEQVQIARLLLSLLALPFYIVGAVAALVWLCMRWAYAALVIGFSDIVARAGGGDAAG